MPSLSRVLAVAFLILAPRVAAGAAFHVTLHEPMGVSFGPAGATFGGGWFDEIVIDEFFQQTFFDDFSGDVFFEAGPALSIIVDSSDPNRVTSRYEFGPGTFLLTADGSDSFGNHVQGHYEAPLLSLVVDIRCEKELSANCGLNASYGDAFASFGAGKFDPALAKALGLAIAGDPFDFSIALDEITENPSSEFRSGGSSRGTEDLDIGVAIPEPSVVSLLLLSLLGLKFRR